MIIKMLSFFYITTRSTQDENWVKFRKLLIEWKMNNVYGTKAIKFDKIIHVENETNNEIKSKHAHIGMTENIYY